MSNAPQGPGWWQGTDGRWHPPGPQAGESDPNSRERAAQAGRIYGPRAFRLLFIGLVAFLFLLAVVGLMTDDSEQSGPGETVAEPILGVSCEGVLENFTADGIGDKIRFTWRTSRPLTPPELGFEAAGIDDEGTVVRFSIFVNNGVAEAELGNTSEGYEGPAAVELDSFIADGTSASLTVPAEMYGFDHGEIRYYGEVIEDDQRIDRCPAAGDVAVG